MVVPGADVAVPGLCLSDHWAFWTLGTLAAAAAAAAAPFRRRRRRQERTKEGKLR